MGKKIFGSGVAAALAMLASPAFAADEAAVAVNAVVAPVCSFTTTPAAVVTVTPDAGEKNLGDLGYTCNFVGNANLVLELPNGTNLNNPDNGGDTVQYGVRWLVPPNGSGTAYQTFGPGNVPFSWPTAGTANMETSGALMIKLPADLTVAGTYSTVISYTIAP